MRPSGPSRKTGTQMERVERDGEGAVAGSVPSATESVAKARGQIIGSPRLLPNPGDLDTGCVVVTLSMPPRSSAVEQRNFKSSGRRFEPCRGVFPLTSPWNGPTLCL